MIRFEGIILAKEPQNCNPDYDFEIRVLVKVNGDPKTLIFKMNSQAHCVVHLRKRIFDSI